MVRSFRFYAAIAACLCLIHCGGEQKTSSSNNNNTAAPPSGTPGTQGQDNSPVPDGTRVLYTFQFGLQVSIDGEPFEPVAFPGTHQVPLTITSSGSVALKAQDFPAMKLRVCPTQTKVQNCNVKVDLAGLPEGFGIDLVMDLCGVSKASAQCGSNDDTVFRGELASNGRLVIRDLAVRNRVFAVGDIIGPTRTGLIPMDRVLATAQTDPEVSTGMFKGIGSRVNGSHVTLVAGGVIPSGVVELGGEHYLATLEGSFDVDPLSLLEE